MAVPWIGSRSRSGGSSGGYGTGSNSAIIQGLSSLIQATDNIIKTNRTKREELNNAVLLKLSNEDYEWTIENQTKYAKEPEEWLAAWNQKLENIQENVCLLYTSPSPRD